MKKMLLTLAVASLGLSLFAATTINENSDRKNEQRQQRGERGERGEERGQNMISAELSEELKNATQNFQSDPSDANREALATVLGKVFDARQEIQKQRLEKLKQEVTKLEESINVDKDADIEERIQMIANRNSKNNRENSEERSERKQNKNGKK